MWKWTRLALVKIILVACANSWAKEPAEISIKAEDFVNKGLRVEVLEKALLAVEVAQNNKKINSEILTVIDFELASTKKRLWVINLETGKLLFHEQVTHGKNTDTNHDGKVDKNGFSNEDGSKKSSLGVFKTAETYHSTKFNGTALKMDGLEKGFNDNARRRAIVMHPAKYADVSEGTKMGRSWGCPAVDPDVSEELIGAIKGGSMIFQYYPDSKWLRESKFLVHE